MKNPSSFRDPSGFIFHEADGSTLRQINHSYKDHYEKLTGSGLYQALVDKKLLIPHEEAGALKTSAGVYKVIRPRPVDFISYPYEWCFGQLRDAALLTLQIQKEAMRFGMSLKDASAFNVQFDGAKPVFIDTLSFEISGSDRPWVAYRQFCKHFLAPLALVSLIDAPLNQLLKTYLDGIPLDLASSLLPFFSRFQAPIFLHIYLHAKSQKSLARKDLSAMNHRMSRRDLMGLVDDLESGIRRFKPRFKRSLWNKYYSDCHYSSEAFSHKKEKVSEYLDKTKPKSVWDIGANNGIFSQLSWQKGIFTVSFDLDHCVVEENYRECAKNQSLSILPLMMDITNPSPAIGWKNQERMSLIQRGPVDLVLALALIHHLALSYNLPLSEIADFFSQMGRTLVIEFVPKTDSQVKEIFLSQPDIFLTYDEENFKEAFGKYFITLESAKLKGSDRTLYLIRPVR